MDTILQILLSWQFITFGLAIAAVVFVIRKIVEYLMETYTSLSKETKLWNHLMLPILPVLLGVLSSYFFKTFPYPGGLSATDSRVIFGLVAGLFSGLIYRIVNGLLGEKITSAFQSLTNKAVSNTDTDPNKKE